MIKHWRLVGILLLLTFMPDLSGCGEAPPPGWCIVGNGVYKQPDPITGCGTLAQVPTRALVDEDADGVAGKKFFGRDCNDADPSIPAKLEVPGDKIDNNCNGQIDELNVKEGHWRLGTPGQPQAKWDIDVTTSEKTAVQYIRCLQFQFSLKSTVNGKTYNITQWQSGLRPTDIPIVDNQFSWKLDRPDESVKITFTGTFIGSSTEKGMSVEVRGNVIVSDTDPEVKAPALNLPYVGQFQKVSPSDEAATAFCRRCYIDGLCPVK